MRELIGHRVTYPRKDVRYNADAYEKLCRVWDYVRNSPVHPPHITVDSSRIALHIFDEILHDWDVRNYLTSVRGIDVELRLTWIDGVPHVVL